ncbi:hypothetical protein CIPAW_16G020100 [Carya illinoinensis]|uniref:Wall-associated receptor kinase galacturonan-binding domain-containing protein n=1 Tax=Carya illinoinensis TaxID=32201 RepID=A0A8T1N1I6_CARIL|nr:hypothetical protein CIPAW_16G020100 [Carya illinoinensis]
MIGQIVMKHIMALHGFSNFLPNACPLKLQRLSIRSAASENTTDHETFPPSRERGGMCFPKMRLLQLIIMTWVVGVILISQMAASAGAATAPIAKPNCPDRCGDVEIPYPFGTSEGCYLDYNYFINCTNDSSRKTLASANARRRKNISLDGHLEHTWPVPVYECYNESGTLTDGGGYVFMSSSKLILGAVTCSWPLVVTILLSLMLPGTIEFSPGAACLFVKTQTMWSMGLVLELGVAS